MGGDELRYVKVTKADGITWVTLNRPEKRNAMSPELHYEMDRTLAELETDPETQVLVLTGAGEAFSAGQDLQKFFRELDDKPAERKRAGETADRWRWYRLSMYDKPTIAMVNGFCVGGAFIQLLACDFAIAAEDATFSLSEINWGILPGSLVSKVLSDAVLFRHALYYACLGEAFDARRAVEIGLINAAVPRKDLERETLALAHRLMAKNPEVLRGTKQALRMVRTMDHQQATEYMRIKMAEVKTRDREHARDAGIAQFIDDKSFKPTYEPAKRRYFEGEGQAEA
jgi:trans-feruloyl-CoA hydratase/vanillin synthase